MLLEGRGHSLPASASIYLGCHHSAEHTRRFSTKSNILSTEPNNDNFDWQELSKVFPMPLPNVYYPEIPRIESWVLFMVTLCIKV